MFIKTKVLKCVSSRFINPLFCAVYLVCFSSAITSHSLEEITLLLQEVRATVNMAITRAVKNAETNAALAKVPSSFFIVMPFYMTY